MKNQEANISEVESAEAQQVVDALVAPWDHFTQPKRIDDRPFRREDIRVKKVTLPNMTYPIFICVPRDLDGGAPDIKKMEVGYSVAAPFIENSELTYLSVQCGYRYPADEVESSHPHSYKDGWMSEIVIPDAGDRSSIGTLPWFVSTHLEGKPITAMALMCGFYRECLGHKHVVVFTQPIVK